MLNQSTNKKEKKIKINEAKKKQLSFQRTGCTNRQS